MNSQEQFYRHLQAVSEAPPADLSTFARQLQKFYPQALALFTHPSKSTEERGKLTNNKRFVYTATGSEHDANEQFIRETTVLSDLLDLSENTAASYIVYGVNSPETRAATRLSETGLVLFYQERTFLLKSLQTLWEQLGDSSPDSELQSVIAQFTDSLMDAKLQVDSVSRRQGSWIEKLLATLVSITTKLNQLKSQTATTGATGFGVGTSTSAQTEATALQINCLESEKNLIAQLLYLIASTTGVNTTEFHRIIEILKELPFNESHAPALLMTILAALDPLVRHGSGIIRSIETDTSLVSKMKSLLETTWAVPGLQATICMSWALFLERAVQHVSSLRTQEIVTTIENNVWKAIDNDVFGFLGLGVLAFKKTAELNEIWGDVRIDVESLWNKSEEEGKYLFQWGQSQKCVSWLQSRFVEEVESLFITIVTQRYATLKKLRAKEEVAIASLTSSRGRPDHEPKPTWRLESLFLLVTTIYYDAPDMATIFFAFDHPTTREDFSARLAPFLRFGMDCSKSSLGRSYYHMLASLSCGPDCSQKMYDTLVPETVELSWTFIFKAFKHYRDNLPRGQASVRPEEVDILIALLRLLSTVSTFSTFARSSFVRNGKYQAVSLLFEVLACQLPHTLKAAILKALSALAFPIPKFNTAHNIWSLLDSTNAMQIVEKDVVETEKNSNTYPELYAFVKLLSTLVTVKNSVLKSFEAQHKASGVDHYSNFVIHQAFLRTQDLLWRDAFEEWTFTDACLEYLETTIYNFDVTLFQGINLQQYVNDKNFKSALEQLVFSPGFYVLAELFSAGPLLSRIIALVTAGYDAIEANRGGPSFTPCVRRCLSILCRALEVQDVFMNVISPAIAGEIISVSPDKFERIVALSQIDAVLVLHPDAVVQSCLCIGCESDDKISFFAVRLFLILSKSPHFDVLAHFTKRSNHRVNRLVTVLASSEERGRAITKVTQRFEADEIAWGVAHSESPMVTLRQLITSDLLDLFLQCTKSDVNAPNIAHLLLGFDLHADSAEQTLDSPDDDSIILLDVIVRLLMTDADPINFDDAFVTRLPRLAARSFQLLEQLCKHPYSGAATLRYLRNKDQFLLQQLQVTPMPIFPNQDWDGTITQNGHTIQLKGIDFAHVLQSQASLLAIVALDINELVLANSWDQVKKLATALYVPDSDSSSGKSIPCILDLFSSMDIVWVGKIDPNSVELKYLQGLKYDSMTQNKDGLQIYDLARISLTIENTLEEMDLTTNDDQIAALAEKDTVLELLDAENTRRTITLFNQHCLEAWKSVLCITLYQAIEVIDVSSRLPLLFDILVALLPPVNHRDTATSARELLGSTAVLVMDAIRTEGTRILESPGVDRGLFLSPGRFTSLFQSTVEAITQSDPSGVLRGNLYVILLGYIQFEELTAKVDSSDSMYHGISDIIQPLLSKLLPIICQDAVSGYEVWRTVAFTLLDQLCALSQTANVLNDFLQPIVHSGFLRNFVTSLKSNEAQLLGTLEPDPLTLNSLYIYEAQTSLLLRIASTVQGTSRLIDAEIYSVLASCKYLEFPVDRPLPSIHLDAFIPPIVERHNQLLLPALQILSGVSVVAGSDNAQTPKQSYQFLRQHIDTASKVLELARSNPSLTLLKEAELIVLLARTALPYFKTEDQPLRKLINGLATSLCVSQYNSSSIYPQTGLEKSDAAIYIPTLSSPSNVYQHNLNTCIIALQTALSLFFVSASQAKSTDSVQSIWLPQYPGEVLPAPTLIGSIEFLEYVAASTIRLISDLSNLKDIDDKKQEVSVVDLENALHVNPNPAMDVHSRRRAVFTYLNTVIENDHSKLASLWTLLELMLLLTWRHVDLFFSPATASKIAKTEALVAFRPVHKLLESFRLPQNLFGPQYQGSENYVMIITPNILEKLS